jgi:UDP-glucose 4-epimerase
LSSTASFAGKRILITGASGFIGSHLCGRLSKIGAEIHAVSRLAASGATEFARWWQADLTHLDSVRSLVASTKPDFIFHLAGQVTGARGLEMVEPTFLNNLASTVNLLTAAKETGCQRILVAGSQEEPDPRDTQPVPCSPYAASKWAAAGYSRMFHRLYGTPVVTLRVFMVYGPAQRDLQKLVPYVIRSLLRGEPPLLTSGERPIDWIYCDDVVDAFIATAHADKVEGEVVDVGSGQTATVRSVVENLVRIMNSCLQPKFGAVPPRPMEQVRVADPAKTLAQIGWLAKTTLDQGLRQTVQWYSQHSG